MRAGREPVYVKEVFCMVRLSEVSAFWMEEDSSSVVVSGAWLRNFGFEPGRKIVVDVTKGQIVIKLVEAVDCEGVEVENYAKASSL
jgi:hypothetical protein